MTNKDFVQWLNGYMDGLDPDHDRSEFTKIRKKIEEINDSFTKVSNSDPIVAFSHISHIVDGPQVDPYWVGNLPPSCETVVSWLSNSTGNSKIITTNDDKMDQKSN